ncbi:MAG: asparagine synthetase B family protein [Solirubrobacterales bacterium]
MRTRGRLAGAFSAREGRVELEGETSVAGGMVCRFDGRLDNAEMLLRELGQDGERAGGGSIEDLLARGFRRWGTSLPERMRGDFALLAWDPERREGLLARDQLGVRPLLLAEAGGRLHFAVELRDLLERLRFTPAPDPAGVAHWVALSARPGHGTLYRGVERLGPGELLHLTPAGPSRHRYWEPRFQEPPALRQEQPAELVQEELRAAVARRRDPERETGVLLSGGLDSSSVAAAAGGELVACSGVFPEHPEADEAELIGELRRDLRLGGVEAEVRPGGLLACALEYVAAWRAPQLGWGDFWTLPLLRAAARRGVGTMLDGDGGDELFGPRLYALADALRRGRPRRALELAKRLPGAGPHVGRREMAAVFCRIALGGAAPPLPASLRPPLGPTGAPDWLDRRSLRLLRRSDDPGAWKRLDGPRWWAASAHGIAYAIEAAGVFEHQLRRATTAGLEARHPILDLDLVELCLRQPPEATLDPRFNRPLLRSAMAGLLPDSVRLRPHKARFESLILACLSGPDAAPIEQLLLAPEAEIGAYVDRRRMADALFGADAVSKEEPFKWMWQVWRLLGAELWLRSLKQGNGFLEPSTAISASRIEIREA